MLGIEQLMFIPRSPCSWTNWCLFPDLPAPGPIDVYSQISLLLDRLMFIPRSPCSWTNWAPLGEDGLCVSKMGTSCRTDHTPQVQSDMEKWRRLWKKSHSDRRKGWYLWTHFGGEIWLYCGHHHGRWQPESTCLCNSMHRFGLNNMDTIRVSWNTDDMIPYGFHTSTWMLRLIHSVAFFIRPLHITASADGTRLK